MSDRIGELNYFDVALIHKGIPTFKPLTWTF